jgi:hypothetical protein
VQRNKILAGFRIVRVAGDHSPALAGADIATETDCVAGHVGLELANVILKKPLIRPWQVARSETAGIRKPSHKRPLRGRGRDASYLAPPQSPARKLIQAKVKLNAGLPGFRVGKASDPFEVRRGIFSSGITPTGEIPRDRVPLKPGALLHD